MRCRKMGDGRLRLETLEGRLAPSDLLGGGNAVVAAEFTIIGQNVVMLEPAGRVPATVPVETSSPVFTFVQEPWTGFYAAADVAGT